MKTIYGSFQIKSVVSFVFSIFIDNSRKNTDVCWEPAKVYQSIFPFEQHSFFLIGIQIYYSLNYIKLKNCSDNKTVLCK